MPVINTEAARHQTRVRPSAWRRLGWFALLWTGSLGVWMLIAYGLRSLLLPT